MPRASGCQRLYDGGANSLKRPPVSVRGGAQRLRLSAMFIMGGCTKPETSRPFREGGCTEPEMFRNLYHGDAQSLRRPTIRTSGVQKA